MDAVRPRLVGCRGHHSPILGPTSYYDWLASPTRMIALLDGSEERIQVDEQDRLALPWRKRRYAVALALCLRRFLQGLNARCRTSTDRRRE